MLEGKSEEFPCQITWRKKGLDGWLEFLGCVVCMICKECGGGHEGHDS